MKIHPRRPRGSQSGRGLTAPGSPRMMKIALLLNLALFKFTIIIIIIMIYSIFMTLYISFFMNICVESGKQKCQCFALKLKAGAM